MGMESGIKILSGSCNSYLIGDILIDAPAEVNFPDGITKIIITHEHCDHIAGLGILVSRVSRPVGIYANGFAADVISKKKNRYALCSFLGYEFPNVEVEPLKNGDVLHSAPRGSPRGDAEVSLRVIETPGHAKGAICLYDEANRILFSGDTIFPDHSMPRTDLPSSEPEKLRQSYERLAELEIRTIYPGHGGKIVERDYIRKLLDIF